MSFYEVTVGKGGRGGNVRWDSLVYSRVKGPVGFQYLSASKCSSNIWVHFYDVINQKTGFDLNLWNAVVKTFATYLSFGDLILGAEGRKLVLQKIFHNHKSTYFSGLLKKKLLLETNFLEKFK